MLAALICQSCLKKVELAYDLSFQIKQSEKLYFKPQRLEYHTSKITKKDENNCKQDKITSDEFEENSSNCKNSQVEDYEYEFVSNESSTSSSKPINLSSDSSENCSISQRGNHQTTVHLFKCAACDKSFQYQQNLEIHIDMWHTEMKEPRNNSSNVQLKSSQKCPEFKARRSRSTSNRYETPKPFKCNFQGCNKAFSAFSLLNYHKVSHSGNI